MSKHIYTKAEQEHIQGNEYVINCSELSITFSVAFKELAIRQYENEGLTPREIFEDAGFNLTVIGETKPGECIKRWRQVVRTNGVKGLTESRGRSSNSGRPKTTFDSDTEHIDYLKAKIAYIEAENAFLKQLRATRRAES